jgi:hypothetical protein
LLNSRAFTRAPALAHFDYEKEIVLETVAARYVSTGVLSQYDHHGILHPVPSCSKKHSAAEENYEIYDQELGAIVKCLKQWRPECEGSPHPIKILTRLQELAIFHDFEAAEPEVHKVVQIFLLL